MKEVKITLKLEYSQYT